MFSKNDKPHQGQPIISKGKALADANAVVILIHGRGATAESILALADELLNASHPHEFGNLAWLAPQAHNCTWYPHSFLAPVDENEPFLSSALEMTSELIRDIEASGVPREKVLLSGFSQGACLSLEFAARNPARYGGIVALSGGLIGADVDETRYSGSLEGTPVFLGCSDFDPHIPEERVHASAGLLRKQNAVVTKKIYKGLGHTVNEDELSVFRSMLSDIL